MKTSRYTLRTDKKGICISVAVVADLHAKDPSRVISALKRACPDIILCAGDIFECFDAKNDKINENGFMFFDSAAKIAPVFYCLGNHETEGEGALSNPNVCGYKCIPRAVLDRLSQIGVKTVFDTYQYYGEKILIGGLASALNRETQSPDMGVLEKMRNVDRDTYKILICHHPEYYPKYLLNTDIDLIVSGHAHGGQWRLLGRGLFAPGQGLFPKLTSGIYDQRLAVSRGCSNSTRNIYVPRLFNPVEIMLIDIRSE